MSEQPAKRGEYISVHRYVFICWALVVSAHLTDDLAAWTGWQVLTVLSATARILAIGYAFLWLTRPRAKDSTRRD